MTGASTGAVFCDGVSLAALDRRVLKMRGMAITAINTITIDATPTHAQTGTRIEVFFLR
jgi:hypothetical protein